jgi:hypothetical protein
LLWLWNKNRYATLLAAMYIYFLFRTIKMVITANPRKTGRDGAGD